MIKGWSLDWSYFVAFFYYTECPPLWILPSLSVCIFIYRSVFLAINWISFIFIIIISFIFVYFRISDLVSHTINLQNRWMLIVCLLDCSSVS